MHKNFLKFIFPLIFILIISSSCALLIDSIRNKRPNIKNLSSEICNFESKIEFIGESKQITNLFSNEYRKWNLNDKELLYAWFLANSQVRPDAINQNANINAFEFQNKKNIIVHANGLEYISKGINKRKVKNFIEKILPRKIRMVNGLHESLQYHSKNEHKIPSKFFLANQLMGSNERYNRSSLNQFQKSTNTHSSNIEMYIKEKSISCFSGRQSTQLNRSTIIGIVFPNKRIIISSSFIPTENVFSPKPGQMNLSLCHFKNQYFDNILIAHGIDNHQSIIRNLIKLNLENIQTIEDLKYYIDYPRFVFNQSPRSITIESLRADQTLENYLNGLKLPIFHQDNIGKILTVYSMLLKDRSGMIVDSRPPAIIPCKEN